MAKIADEIESCGRDAVQAVLEYFGCSVPNLDSQLSAVEIVQALEAQNLDVIVVMPWWMQFSKDGKILNKNFAKYLTFKENVFVSCKYAVVIVGSAFDLYGLKKDWMHVVTFLKNNEEWILHDPYLSKIEQDYPGSLWGEPHLQMLLKSKWCIKIGVCL